MGTRDGGATWVDLTEDVRDLPGNTYVSRIVASNAEVGRVYATFDAHYSGDFAPYVYVSDDYGERWRSITDGLPQTSVNVLTEHPDEGDLLFLGNEVGVFVSLDGGDRWDPLMNGLPTVPVDDIRVNSAVDDLLIGTHGRGIWVLDDIAALEQLVSGWVMASTPYLFRGGRAIQWRRRNIQEWTAPASSDFPIRPSAHVSVTGFPRGSTWAAENPGRSTRSRMETRPRMRVRSSRSKSSPPRDRRYERSRGPRHPERMKCFGTSGSIPPMNRRRTDQKEEDSRHEGRPCSRTFIRSRWR